MTRWTAERPPALVDVAVVRRALRRRIRREQELAAVDGLVGVQYGLNEALIILDRIACKPLPKPPRVRKGKR